ncbi:MAG: MFS transporter [Candidatus Bathyarchaeota archaeon]|nr:MFS transporter [Candidatus Termiticorpusculum sp.]
MFTKYLQIFSPKHFNLALKCILAMWRFGFFFHEMAFGLLSVFIPLYVVGFQDTSVIGGPLVALGIMMSVATFCSIPASFLWGWLCDATRRCKPFILLSFASSAVLLFLMTLSFAQNIIVFIVLYVIMQFLHIAHEAPKNVLIAEHYSRDEWEKSYGYYRVSTELGLIIGLVIGFCLSVGLFSFTANLSSVVLANYTLYLCSGLSVVAFILSVLLVADPLMIFERRLVRIERDVDFTYRSAISASRVLGGSYWDGLPKKDSFKMFALAIVLFSLATSIFFTPLPVFLSQGLGLSNSMVYIGYIFTSIGATAGYFFISGRARSMDIRKQMPRYVLYRSLLVFVLIGIIQLALYPTLMTFLILVFLGFCFAVYYILMISISMELIPAGKSGVFDGLVGLGTALGSFLGPYLASTYNYLPTYFVAALLFLLAFISIKLAT